MYILIRYMLLIYPFPLITRARYRYLLFLSIAAKQCRSFLRFRTSEALRNQKNFAESQVPSPALLLVSILVVPFGELRYGSELCLSHPVESDSLFIAATSRHISLELCSLIPLKNILNVTSLFRRQYS